MARRPSTGRKPSPGTNSADVIESMLTYRPGPAGSPSASAVKWAAASLKISSTALLVTALLVSVASRRTPSVIRSSLTRL